MKSPLIAIPLIDSRSTASIDEKLGQEEPSWYISRKSYVDLLGQSGGIVVYIPKLRDISAIDRLLDLTQGLLLTGGADIDPGLYNESIDPVANVQTNPYQDDLDFYLIDHAVRNKKPILGICRGMQAINVAFGGTLHQDISSFISPGMHISGRYPSYSDSCRTDVVLAPQTHVSKVLKSKKLTYNCSHHQAIKEMAKGFTAAGTSSDGVIEAIERIDQDHWIVGLQGHPEATLQAQTLIKPLIEEFVRVSARSYR